MPENEFEKKVASELGGLKFKPSEEVWQKVEERIRRKKNRRVVVIVFLLAGMALLGYWQRDFLFGEKNDGIVNNKEQVEVKDKVNAEKKEVDLKDEVNKQNENKTAEMKVGDEKVKDDIVVKSKESNSTTKNVSKLDKTTSPKTQVQKNKASSKNIPVKTKQSDEESDMQVTVVDADVKAGEKKDMTAVKEIIDSAVKADLKADDKKEEVVIQTETNPVETKIDSVNTEIAEKKPDAIEIKDSAAKAIDIPKDSAAAVVQKRSENKKWKWGIELTPGISSMAEGLFSLNLGKSFADLNYQAPSSGSGTGSSLPPGSPSSSTAGFAFHTGVFAEKQFSMRSSVSIGLRYAYYSDKINVGARSYPSSGSLFLYLDSRGTNNSYATRNSFSNYTNRYHFIELPVSYDLRLNKNQEHPFDLQLGFKLGRMIASDALVYDSIAGGIYYKSKDFLNKTQFGLSTGLNWTILNKTQFQWRLGPVVNVHLNSLTDNPMDSKKYIFFAGFRSSFILNSKK